MTTKRTYSAEDITAIQPLPQGDLWIFGYGSLMWRPGFPVLQTRRAIVHGWRRSLCVWSWVHRGTQQKPGLVMGLDRGGACVGQALKIAAEERDHVLAYLAEREMVTAVYVPRLVSVRMPGHTEPVSALTFIADRAHPQYAPGLSVDDAARTVRAGQGQSGANPDYVLQTVEHLDELGIRDTFLRQVAARL